MQRILRPSIAIALKYATNATTADATAVPFNGYLVGYALVVPTLDASATVTLNVKDADGNVLYTKTGIAANATEIVILTGTNAIPLSGNITFEVVTSANQTADHNFTVKPLVDSYIDH